MTNTIQILRSSTVGGQPLPGTRQAGEVWVNFADGQFGYINVSQNAQKLIAARYFLTSAAYNTGDYSFYNGNLYQANTNITPGVFNATQWNLNLTAGGGTMTGALILAADPLVSLGAATKQYADKMVPLAGGTMTGELIVAPATGDASIELNKTTGNNAYIYGATGGLDRWSIDIGDNTAESGGNVGSNFVIGRYSDAGTLIDEPVTITRSTGVMSVANAPVGANDVATKSYVDAGTAIVGSITVFAGATIPTNWLVCDGTLYNISTYPTLFAAISNTYGGDGITTFGVPNCIGKVILGAGTGYALASTGGEATHTLTTAELAAHTHGVTQTPHGHADAGHTHAVTDPGHAHTVPLSNTTGGTGGLDTGPGGSTATSSDTTGITNATGHASIGTSNANVSVNNAGGGGPHNNLQPYIAMNIIIRAQ